MNDVGRIVGMFGESGRDARQFNWIHGLACPSPDTLVVADMNNWRVLKVQLKTPASGATGSR